VEDPFVTGNETMGAAATMGIDVEDDDGAVDTR
jgi:hypothetical protein